MHLLKVNKLRKKYSALVAIGNLDFSVEEGEFVAIVGPNGCGKTTLLNILAGLDNDFEGSVSTPDSLRLGFVFQNSHESVLPWRTVKENLILGKNNINKKKLSRTIKQAGLWQFRERYPYQLSGGMKQLLAISRAFVHDCKLLLLDEPFSSLDPHTSVGIHKKLLDLWQREKPSMIFVSHNLDDAIMLADKIIVLSARPAKIKEILMIDLPRPRNFASPEFFQYKKRLLEHFENEIY